MGAGRTILLVTARPDPLDSLIAELGGETGFRVAVAGSAEDAIDGLGRMAPILVVVDQQVGPVAALDLVRRLLTVDAFIHTAVISDLDEADFHERSEGLGILAKLPVMPGRQDARTLLERLRQVTPDQSY